MLYLSSLYLDSFSAGNEEITTEVKDDKPGESEKRLPPLPNDNDVHVPDVSGAVLTNESPIVEAGLRFPLPRKLWPSPS